MEWWEALARRIAGRGLKKPPSAEPAPAPVLEEPAPASEEDLPAPATDGYPATFIPFESAEGVSQISVFDPALCHYVRAFRNGDPVFDDPIVGAKWRAARRFALDHALSVLAATELGEPLVLRGSRLLREWYPQEAREPGDLDFVAPFSWKLEGEGERLASEISGLLTGAKANIAEGLTFTGEVRRAPLWTYERAPGYRLVFPWSTAMPGARNSERLFGAAQIDIVFGEAQSQLPISMAITREDTEGLLSVRAASKQQSLAWKLQWLLDDIHPQGKDLYDAVLLAEDVGLEGAALDELDRFLLAELAGLHGEERARIDWKNVALEMPPGDAGTAHEWLTRLRACLPPVDGERVP